MFGIPLWQRVFIGLALGLLLGALLPAAAPPIAWVGDVFVRLIRMLVVPVVFFSIAGGVAALADPARLGSLGGRALLLFFVTTLLAVAIGMAVAVAIEPGHGLSSGSPRRRSWARAARSASS